MYFGYRRTVLNVFLIAVSLKLNFYLFKSKTLLLFYTIYTRKLFYNVIMNLKTLNKKKIFYCKAK